MATVGNSMAIIIIGLGLIFNSLNIHELARNIQLQGELNTEQIKHNKLVNETITQLADREIARTKDGR